jgi:pSer/pThr/pTyr-binding forkhead associated (FHA) protein
LRIIEPPQHEGQTFDLDDELTIGRSPGCGVPTPDDIYTSTLHARLFRKNDQLWIEDLGSTNGTYVNSEKISQAQRLGKGDVLQVGSTVYEVAK